MQILIGGSPSTGSSLLRQMLNRHPDVYCGPETCLFAFPKLIERWNASKGKLMGRRLPLAARLKSPSIRLINKAQLTGREQGWEPLDIKTLIHKAGDFKSFADSYFARPCSLYSKQHWAEKTPENVLAFGVFKEIWREGHVIHITRSPADTVSSLRARGLSLFEAVARYLYHTAIGLGYREGICYHEVEYAALVTDPERTLTRLLLGLGLPFSDEMLKSGNPNMAEADKMGGWTYSELEAPGTQSVDRFASEVEATRQEIVAAIHLLRIPNAFAARHGLIYQNIPSIAEAIGYLLPPPEPGALPTTMRRLRREMQRHRWRRVRTFDWFLEREKPLEIISPAEVGS